MGVHMFPILNPPATSLPVPYFILYSKAKLACYTRYLLISYFCISILYDEKDFFILLVLEDLLGLHRTIQLQLFSNSGWDIDLDYCDIEWFASEVNRGHSVVFEIVPKNGILESFLNYEGYSISKGFLPIVVDIMVI